MLLWHCKTYLVLFNQYLAITKRQKLKIKRRNIRKLKILLTLIKVVKGKGAGSAKVDNKFLNVNIIYFAKVDKGEWG